MIKDKLIRVNKHIDILKDSLDRLYKIREKIESKCKHEETFNESHCNSGSYLDRASTTTLTKCSICGKVVKSDTERHPFYG